MALARLDTVSGESAVVRRVTAIANLAVRWIRGLPTAPALTFSQASTQGVIARIKVHRAVAKTACATAVVVASLTWTAQCAHRIIVMEPTMLAKPLVARRAARVRR